MVIPISLGAAIAVVTVLCFFSFALYRRIRKLEKNLFSYQRVLEQKTSILENATSQLTAALPPDLNPALREKKLLGSLEALVQDFSVSLNRATQEQVAHQNDLWHEKFSALLKALGKTEKDLVRDNSMKEAWVSIVELRQKSQLLFDDMREDGIFFRIQSLWLMGNLAAAQGRFIETWRSGLAALRLFRDSSPRLPLTKSLMWKIAEDLIVCSKNLEPHQQRDMLDKFHITPGDIAAFYIELDKFEAQPDSLQKLRSWAHQIQNY